MIVYHSSYAIVNTPDVLHSREALDFGKGFYVTVMNTPTTKFAFSIKV